MSRMLRAPSEAACWERDSSLLSPSVIIFGGAVWPVAAQVAGLVTAQVTPVALTEAGRSLPIVATGLGAAAPLIGAASLALEQVFSIPVFTVQQ